MTTTLRLTATAFALLAGAGVAAHPVSAAVEAPKGAAVPFETLAIVSGTSGINLPEDQILRLTSADDLEVVGALLADGYEPTLADGVVDAVDEVPAGSVVLVGVIDMSCTRAEAAGLVRLDDGRLDMFAPGHVPAPIECFVANITVAVLEVDAAEAPPGSTDLAELVHFDLVGVDDPAGVAAVELTDDADALAAILPSDAAALTLPELAAEMRRFAFIGSGCQLATAELWVTLSTVTARFDQEDPGNEVVCVRAEHYLAVFDIPTDDVPPNAEPDSSIVG